MANSPDNPQGFSISGIAQIAICVKDLERATNFYRDSLGLTFLFQAPPGLSFFQCGAVRLMLAKPETPELDHPSSILYFNVSDIEIAHRTMLDRGVAFVGTPHVVHRGPGFELWLADFHDSEGNLLALMEHKNLPTS